jgi:hypothetical protein
MSIRAAQLELSTPVGPVSPVGLRGAHQAYRMLHVAFIVLPIVAGFDKFTDALVDWDRYLAPGLARISTIASHQFMQLVGLIEIVAGLLVAVRPAVGGYVIAAWLWAIAVNLLLGPGSYDVALRDIGLSLGALALARLSPMFRPGRTNNPRR